MYTHATIIEGNTLLASNFQSSGDDGLNQEVHKVSIPIYSTHDMDRADHRQITSAVLIQHGNLRNGNDYFCGAVNSLIQSQNDTVMQSTIVVAPQFLVQGDQCWDKDMKSSIINASDIGTWCGFHIWSSDGWKDGLLSVPRPLAGQGDGEGDGEGAAKIAIFSYDVLNLLVDRLQDRRFFPNLQVVTLFGFSAGAQVLLRHSVLPIHRRGYTEQHAPAHIRYVISDPSTYLYFDSRRPRPGLWVQRSNAVHLTLNTTNEVASPPSVTPAPSLLPPSQDSNPHRLRSWIKIKSDSPSPPRFHLTPRYNESEAEAMFNATYIFEIPDSSWNRWQVGLIVLFVPFIVLI